jgi:hypothetical protein
MVAKVNGGVFKDQTLVGNLRAFVISGVNFSAAGRMFEVAATANNETWTLKSGVAVAYNEGDSVPDTIADIIVRAISSRATVVSVNARSVAANTDVTDELHVIVENSSGWGYTNAAGTVASLATALQGLGASVAVSVKGGAAQTVDMSAATAVECKMFFDITSTYTPPAIGGIGGNEHDQDTVSNAVTAP